MSMDNPRTHAEREAAQRADEAELHACLCCGATGTVQDVLYHHLCARCNHRCYYPPCGQGAPHFCAICAPHTHPCPTCHQARACTRTRCADGPRECATCSNCRGW
jgi:hypothetical protein